MAPEGKSSNNPSSTNSSHRPASPSQARMESAMSLAARSLSQRGRSASGNLVRDSMRALQFNLATSNTGERSLIEIIDDALAIETGHAGRQAQPRSPQAPKSQDEPGQKKQ